MSMFRIGGLATGMDTYQMIQDLMKAHRQPVDKLRQQRIVLEWQREEYRAVNTALLDFRINTVAPLRLNTTFKAKAVDSSNSAVVTATASPNTANATYNVEVTSLATAAYRTSTAALSADPEQKIDADAPLWSEREKFTGSASLETLGETFTFTVTTYGYDGEAITREFDVDATSMSLNDVLLAISGDSELGLTAFYDAGADQVSLATSRTGENNPGGPQIEFGGDGADFLTEVLFLNEEQGGTNAMVTVNGMEIERPTNDFTLNNVNFSLKGTGTSTVTVRVDADAVVDHIKNFVEEYNNLLDLINGKLQEERYRDYPPLLDDDPLRETLTERQIDQWQEKARSGLLRYDSLLSGIITRMRNDVFSSVSGLDESLNHLAHIGITVGSFADRGKLVIDETKLRSAVEQDPDGVAQLFTKSGDTTEEQGIARRLYDYLDTAIKRVTSQAGSAAYAYDQSWLGRQIGSLDERIARAEERLAHLEERYWRQFTALERAISRMNTQSMWLMQQFGGGMYQG